MSWFYSFHSFNKMDCCLQMKCLLLLMNLLWYTSSLFDVTHGMIPYRRHNSNQNDGPITAESPSQSPGYLRSYRPGTFHPFWSSAALTTNLNNKQNTIDKRLTNTMYHNSRRRINRHKYKYNLTPESFRKHSQIIPSMSISDKTLPVSGYPDDKVISSVSFEESKHGRYYYNYYHNQQKVDVLSELDRKVHNVRNIPPFPRPERYCQDWFSGLQRFKTTGRVFKCATKCTCMYDYNKNVIADCWAQQLLDFPTTLPAETISIDLSENDLHLFETSVILRYYTKLRQLDLRNNRIESIIFGDTNTTSSESQFIQNALRVVNLYTNRINRIEDGALKIFPHLEGLHMSNNFLKNVTSKAFQGLTNLVYLDLSYNDMESIHYDSFDQFNNLAVLCLNENHKLWIGKYVVRPRLFEKLKSLKVFYLQTHKISFTRYPNNVFEKLPQLEELSVNGISLPLFSKPMMYMHTLRIGREYDGCSLKTLSAITLKNVPNLTTLIIKKCSKLKSIDKTAFNSTPNLHTLEISTFKSYDLIQAFKDMKQYFQNSSLTYLKLSGLSRDDHKCRLLITEYGEYLSQIPLKQLDISSNNLLMVESGFLEQLPKTLVRLDMSDNKQGVLPVMWYYIYLLPNLEELVVDMQDSNEHLDVREEQPMVTQGYSTDQTKLTVNNGNNKLPYFYNHNIISKDVSKGIKLPINLRTVTASSYISFGKYLLFAKHNLHSNNLTNLDFSRSMLTVWKGGQLPNKAELVDLSHNYCNQIDSHFIPEHNSLTYLDISNNHLGISFANDHNGSIFSKARNLNYLDISSNDIYHLPRTFFTGMKNLTTFIAKDNRMRVFNMTLKHMKFISYIDVSKNSINHITKQTQEEIDHVASKRYLQINLNWNSLPCTCDSDSLDLWHWMASSSAEFVGKSLLTCMDSDGNIVEIENLMETVRMLERKCGTSIIFYVVLAINIVFLFTYFVVAIYKNRWNLRFWWNTLLARQFGFTPQMTSGRSGNPAHMFDAYVIYHKSDKDFVLQNMLHELEDKRGHKLCIEVRNFIPGTLTFNNISSAIHNSTVTLLVLSRALLLSSDADYAINMAMMEEYYSTSKRPVLHVLLSTDVSSKSIPRNVLSVLKKDRYLELPFADSDHVVGGNQPINGDQYFWDDLSHMIGCVRHERII